MTGFFLTKGLIRCHWIRLRLARIVEDRIENFTYTVNYFMFTVAAMVTVSSLFFLLKLMCLQATHGIMPPLQLSGDDVVPGPAVLGFPGKHTHFWAWNESECI
jgi:hypothetical protein